jgi:hypothetical protein
MRVVLNTIVMRISAPPVWPKATIAGLAAAVAFAWAAVWNGWLTRNGALGWAAGLLTYTRNPQILAC